MSDRAGHRGESRNTMPALAARRRTCAVEGLQDTLQVEVTHMPSSVSKVMNLRTVFNDPGHYAADLIPTSPGHYRFRFFGTIEGERSTLRSIPGPEAATSMTCRLRLRYTSLMRSHPRASWSRRSEACRRRPRRRTMKTTRETASLPRWR